MIKPSTFSIVAHDPVENNWGIAVASKFLAVGAVVPFAQAPVGAVATQSYANLSYGPRGLHLMAQGMSAQATLENLIRDDEGRETRQVGIVDAKGQVATFTGKACMEWAGGITGKHYTAQGNILTGEKVVMDMAEAFEQTSGEFSERLYRALLAGDNVGGDKRGRQSACLIVVKPNGSYGGYTDRYLDLRVDDHRQPVQEMGNLLELHHLFFGSTKPEDRITIDKALAQELQSLLQKLNYYNGDITGTWDKQTQEAFFAFTGIENLEERVHVAEGQIDPPALAFIRKNFSGK